ncbi:His/Gly/Thr/Pro-type tRNA ligase C-terminal domain-containing protein, partial [Desulforudis sp. 1190]
FALGLERTLLLLKEQRPEAGAASRLEVFVATAGETKETAMQILFRLRRLGIVSDADLTGRSLKAQMKYAGKLKARVVVIVGDEELARGAVTVRRMDTGQQEEVPLDDLAEVLKALLK